MTESLLSEYKAKYIERFVIQSNIQKISPTYLYSELASSILGVKNPVLFRAARARTGPERRRELAKRYCYSSRPGSLLRCVLHDVYTLRSQARRLRKATRHKIVEMPSPNENGMMRTMKNSHRVSRPTKLVAFLLIILTLYVATFPIYVAGQEEVRVPGTCHPTQYLRGQPQSLEQNYVFEVDIFVA